MKKESLEKLMTYWLTRVNSLDSLHPHNPSLHYARGNYNALRIIWYDLFEGISLEDKIREEGPVGIFDEDK